MDFITVTTAVVLFVILLVWYALLEYLERRQRKGLEPSKTLTVIGGRKESHEGWRDVEPYVHQYSRSDGKPPPRAQVTTAPDRQQLPFQGPVSRYGFAVISVLLAYALVTLGNLLF